MQFHHIGVPSKTVPAGAAYLDSAKVHVTDPGKHPYHIELVHIEAGSPLPEELYKNPHVAFTVQNVDAAIKGEKVIFPATTVAPGVRVAFIQKDGMYLELMQLG